MNVESLTLDQTLPRGNMNARPHLTIRPRRGWIPLDLRELWQFRDLFWSLANRDVKLRYKQTVLGVIWVILQPLMAAGIFAIVFGGVARLEAPGQLPYFVFSYAGLLGWNLFSNTLNRLSSSLVGNSQLISKVFFPRLILPLSGVGSVLIDFLVAAGMMLVLMLIHGITPSASILLVPFWIALLLALAIGIGLCTAALAVSYRDINYILPVFIQMLLYATPVPYALSTIPDKWLPFFLANPLTGIIEGFRWSILNQGDLRIDLLAWSITTALVLLIAGLYSFKRMEKRFADVI